jgi:hypothetical protein
MRAAYVVALCTDRNISTSTTSQAPPPTGDSPTPTATAQTAHDAATGHGARYATGTPKGLPTPHASGEGESAQHTPARSNADF